jgi:hypothetical protein
MKNTILSLILTLLFLVGLITLAHGQVEVRINECKITQVDATHFTVETTETVSMSYTLVLKKIKGRKDNDMVVNGELFTIKYEDKKYKFDLKEFDRLKDLRDYLKKEWFPKKF